MFRKFHIQMTIFSTFITSTILVLMAIACLFISEKGTRDNIYTSFRDNASSCIAHLENQTLISHQWIQKTENSYGLHIDIRDNGNPLFFQELNPDTEVSDAMEKAAEISRDTQGLDLTTTGNMITKTAYFKMAPYYAATALIPKKQGTLSVIILYPLDSLNRQLATQRFFFAGAVLAAISALGVFSWFFTRKMILPLEKSQRKQTQFIAAASHELRSPLAVILSGISALKKAEAEEQPRFLSLIEKEGTRMSRLVNDMLSLANADNHSWTMFPSSCELDTLLLDTYEKYDSLMAKKHLRFHINLPDSSLSPCICDPGRISQVLGILLDNAISYVPEGGTVCLSLEETESDFRISVSDNGPGIPDEAKKTIFQRFYRASDSRNDKSHFGLGLCIAKEIIVLHKGSIAVTDAPEGGALFLIRLPK